MSRFCPHLCELCHLQNLRRTSTGLTICSKFTVLVHRQARSSHVKQRRVMLNTIRPSLCSAGSGTIENPEKMSSFSWHTRLLEEDGRLQIDRQCLPCRLLFKHTSPFTPPSFTVFYNIPLLTKLLPWAPQNLQNSFDGSLIAHTQNFSSADQQHLPSFN